MGLVAVIVVSIPILNNTSAHTVHSIPFVFTVFSLGMEPFCLLFSRILAKTIPNSDLSSPTGEVWVCLSLQT